MASNFVDLVIEKGIDKVNISMLDEKSRKMILGDAGSQLVRMGKFEDGVKALALAGEKEKLIKLAEDFAKEKQIRLAALAIENSGDIARIEAIAAECVNLGLMAEALKLYKAAGNEMMANFVLENFK
ncbi:hypothetical protein HYU07_07615 [Candidatus Woesearchaeota archaeon]|nr:hypothetical protein [Candidatus Woesearchaeota archaeon]